MLYYFIFYLFLLPLEYIQEKIPKGPTGMNYQTLSLLAMLVWLLVGQRRPAARGVEARSVGSPLSLFLVALLAWNFFCRAMTGSSIPTLDSVLNPTSPNFGQFLQFMNGFLLFWIVVKLFHDRKRLNWLLWAIVLSAPLVFRAFRSDFHGSGGGFSNELRGRGPFVNVGSNELAAYFLYCGLFFLVYFFQKGKRLWPRILYMIPGGLYAYGVLFSYSRGAWMSYLVGIGLIGVLRQRLILAVLIAGAVTGPMWLPQSVIDRYMMTENEEGQLESSAESRVVFHARAIEMWRESPVVGHGVGSFKAKYGMDTHGVYHRTLAEQGAVGFAIFMAMWGMILYMSARLWLEGPVDSDRQYGFGLMVTTVALMIANIFGDRFTHLPMIGQYWVLVGIGGRLYANMVGAAALDDEAGVPAPAEHEAAGRPEIEMNIVQPPAPPVPRQPIEPAPAAPSQETEMQIVSASSTELNIVSRTGRK
ncbi:MAG: O-antigen ligase family protein [Candidatus Sumerlaeia bacterium]